MKNEFKLGIKIYILSIIYFLFLCRLFTFSDCTIYSVNFFQNFFCHHLKEQLRNEPCGKYYFILSADIVPHSSEYLHIKR